MSSGLVCSVEGNCKRRIQSPAINGSSSSLSNTVPAWRPASGSDSSSVGRSARRQACTTARRLSSAFRAHDPRARVRGKIVVAPVHPVQKLVVERLQAGVLGKVRLVVPVGQRNEVVEEGLPDDLPEPVPS